LCVFVQYVGTICFNVRTQAAVFQEVGSVMVTIVVEIGLMNRTAVSDSYSSIVIIINLKTPDDIEIP